MTSLTIRQVYHVSEERIQKYTTHGFGDYLRGCIFLHQYCMKMGYKLEIDFSHHPISNFLVSNTKSDYDMENVNYIFVDDPLSHFSFSGENEINVFINKFYQEPISNETKQFIRKECLSMQPIFEEKVNKTLKDLKLYNYVVLHLRLGDNSFEGKVHIEHQLKNINRLF